MTNQIIQLDPGADLLDSISQFSSKNAVSGFVISIVGNLSIVRFQCPDNSLPVELKGNLEIISLNGTFSPDRMHLHLSFSDSECKVWGGHLEKGTKILKGAEILLQLNTLVQENSEPKIDVNKANKPKIEIAVLPNCPWSARVLRILESNNIPYKKSIVESDELFHFFKNRSGVETFPQIFIGNSFIGGFHEFSQLYNSGKLTD